MRKYAGKITSLVKDSVTNLEETENEEQELDEFKDVTIDLECADITIKRGESYHLNISRTENYKLSTSFGGCLHSGAVSW